MRARWGITVAERLLELELTATLCLPGVAFSLSVDTEHMRQLCSHGESQIHPNT